MSLSSLINNTKILDQVHHYLEERPQGISSADLVEGVLRIHHVPFKMAFTFARALLAEDPRFVEVEERWMLRQVEPEKDSPVWDRTYVAVDIETTGSDPPKGRVMEIGAVRIKKGEIEETFSMLVNPRRPIPPYVARMTGIAQSMVARAPLAEKVLPQFLEFLGDSVFLAHNAPFDSRFLRNECAYTVDRVFGNPVMCTLKLCRRLIVGTERHNLDAMCEFFNIPVPKRHRALDDAMACARIFQKLVDRLSEAGLTTYRELRDFERTGTWEGVAQNLLPRPAKPSATESPGTQ